LAFALYGITAITAPTIGPTLGGWLTDNYSWRWIFYINLPVGLMTLFLVFRMVEDPPYLSRVNRAGVRVDYIGIALLTLGIGALQILLDKGQEDDWFGSHFIVALAATSAICLVSLVLWELHTKTPVIDVRMYKSFNFAMANLMMFVLGVLLFASLVLMPQFLQTLMGYTAQSAGLVLSGASLLILFEMPITGQLTTKIPAKYIMAFGWLSLAFGMYYSTKGLDLLISFKAASWLRIVHAFGLGFLFVPINLSAYIGVPPEKGNNVSGLVNFMRNIGSSVGTSMVTTLLARRSQFHQSILSYHATNYDPAFRNQLSGLSAQLTHAGASVPDAQVQAYGRIYQSMLVQSQTLAYIDIFMVLAVGAAIMFLLSFIVRRNDPASGGHVVAE
jgi:DHA2 family multidrug resistance protein